jgi:hypothetical protein
MIKHLSMFVKGFPGAANQTHCFAHILNLVTKSILHQFEPQKKTRDSEADNVDNPTKALAALTQELEVEDSAELADNPEEGLEALADTEFDADTELEVNDNDNNGLGDKHDGMSEQDEAELEESLVLIWLMLIKVNHLKLSSKIIL